RSSKGIEPCLLPHGIGSRRARRLVLQRAVHPLVSSVLLRRGWVDEVELNPKLRPPRRQPGQPGGPGRAERRPVIAADRPWQSILAKYCGKGRQRPFDGWRHDPDLEQKPAVAVGHRQGIDPALIQGAEMAFEVCTPFVIGSLRLGARPRQGNWPAPPLNRSDQAAALEDVADRRGRWPSHLRLLSPELCQQFARPHVLKTLAYPDDCLLQLIGGRMRAMQRSMR